jgi:CheY-like chemotaxis protein
MSNKILVVEDEPTLLETLEYNLTRQGYEVCTAADGPAALAGARRLPAPAWACGGFLPRSAFGRILRVSS